MSRKKKKEKRTRTLSCKLSLFSSLLLKNRIIPSKFTHTTHTQWHTVTHTVLQQHLDIYFTTHTRFSYELQKGWTATKQTIEIFFSPFDSTPYLPPFFFWYYIYTHHADTHTLAMPISRVVNSTHQPPTHTHTDTHTHTHTHKYIRLALCSLRFRSISLELFQLILSKLSPRETKTFPTIGWCEQAEGWCIKVQQKTAPWQNAAVPSAYSGGLGGKNFGEKLPQILWPPQDGSGKKWMKCICCFFFFFAVEIFSPTTNEKKKWKPMLRRRNGFAH